eukprot:scaffold305612_cov14-Tisochrysis_lutea.AAC.1
MGSQKGSGFEVLCHLCGTMPPNQIVLSLKASLTVISASFAAPIFSPLCPLCSQSITAPEALKQGSPWLAIVVIIMNASAWLRLHHSRPGTPPGTSLSPKPCLSAPSLRLVPLIISFPPPILTPALVSVSRSSLVTVARRCVALLLPERIFERGSTLALFTL